MGSVHPKQVAAAIAAVLQCAAETEAGLPGVCSLPPRAAAAPLAPAPLWGWAGRQEAMHDRVVWQRRLSKSW